MLKGPRDLLCMFWIFLSRFPQISNTMQGLFTVFYITNITYHHFIYIMCNFWVYKVQYFVHFWINLICFSHWKPINPTAMHQPTSPVAPCRHKESSSLAVRLFDPTGVKLWPQEEQNYWLRGLWPCVIAVLFSHDSSHRFAFVLISSPPFDIFLEGN